MKKFICLLFVAFAVTNLYAQTTKPSYQLFTSKGKKVTLQQLAEDAGKSEVVLFGELHDCTVAHELQLELAKEVYKQKDSNFFIGAEMLELHQTAALQTFLVNGDLQQLKDSASMWSNFDSDYAPLLVWAQQQKINYIATNVTRKYASLIFKKGLSSLDTLPSGEQQYMCPLPFPFDSTLTQYVELIKMGKEMHASGIDFALAQAIKDATMAYSICQELDGKNTCLHLNGGYHSDYYQGIMWYIEHYRKGTKILTISTVTQSSLSTLKKENKGKADYILVTGNY